MSQDISDRNFTDRAARHLPRGALPPGFEAALLASYDAWKGARSEGSLAAWRVRWGRFADLVWPGAPLWAPAAALAAALFLGAGVGAILPLGLSDDAAAFSLEQPAAFSLLSPALPPEEL